MNFCSNLQKLRKKKNISQEQLAEQLGVTRQSVSKWESGASYPEMDKLIMLCKVFDCELDTLVNKNIDEIEDYSSTKKILSNFFRNVGNGITKTIKMIEGFSFKELVKFIIQIFIIILVILLCEIPFSMISDAFYNIFVNSNNVIGDVLASFCSFIITLAYSIFAIITFFYVYKVKFLDEEKEIEEKPNERVYNKQPEKQKHIIKSDKMTILDFILMLIIYFCKFVVIIFMFPIVTCLIGVTVSFCILLFLMFKGLYLIGPILILFGIIIFVITLIKVLFNFIVNVKSKFKYVFITMISSIIIFSIGIVPTMTYFTEMEYIDEVPDIFEKKVKEEVIQMSNDIFIHDVSYGNMNYIVDESLENDIKIKITYYEDVYMPKIIKNKDNTYSLHVDIPKKMSINKYTDEIINNIKEKKIYSYYQLSNVDIEIIGSQKNISQIVLNKEKGV